MRELGKRFRTRIKPGFPGATVLGEMFFYLNGVWKSATQAFKDLGFGDQRTFVPEGSPPSKGEYCWDDLHPGPPWTSGGPFSKVTVSLPTDSVSGWAWHERPGVPFYNYWTGYVPMAWNGGFIPYGIESYDLYAPIYGNVTAIMNTPGLSLDPTAYGPEAWAKTAPKIEMASGFVALAESRDLPRMLQTTSKGFHDVWSTIASGRVSAAAKIMKPKKAADQFLNAQFGWAPFLSDMMKFHKAFQNTASYMSRMSHGNDRWKVYRRTIYDDFKSTKIHEGTEWWVLPFGQFFQSHLTDGQPPKSEIWLEESTRITSSGRFKWYKPEFDLTDAGYDNPLSAINRQMTMYGVRISPSNVWRSTPWTWLADWSFNIGRNIDRITEFLVDGVVSQYLYVMARGTRTLRFRQTLPFVTGPVVLEFTREIDVKQRQSAGSPYGFDSPWENLSPMRLAILGALGISRHG